MPFRHLSCWENESYEVIKNQLANRDNATADYGAYLRASILLPFFVENKKLHLIYIQRAAHFLADGTEAVHSRQIAFAGGKQEKNERFVETALREAEEEIDLKKDSVTILGQLGTFVIPVSNYASSAFLGQLKKRPVLRPNADEVADIFYIPLQDLVNQHLQHPEKINRTHERGIHYHWRPPHRKKEICIWGMTGRITWHVLQMINKIDEINENET